MTDSDDEAFSPFGKSLTAEVPSNAMFKRKSTQIEKGITKLNLHQERIHSKYEFGKTLGQGAFGIVKAARLYDDHEKIFAIKCIPRDMFRKKEDTKKGDDDSSSDDAAEEMLKMLESEISIVMLMDHPNIVKFYQSMYDNKYINIVMEMVKGIPLNDYMNKKKGKKLPEDESQIIMR